MIEVEKALELIHQTAVKKRSHFTAVSSDACGSVLADDIFAQMSLPHFAQSSMDGYAIKSHNSLSYNLIGEVAAGAVEEFHLQAGQAVRIFTGAKVPDSADVVVIQEKVQRTNNQITLEQTPKTGQNIRTVGSQIQAGDHVLTKGHTLNPSSLGLLQSLGVRSVQVYKKPSVSIVLTGNELVKAGDRIQQGKVFESNCVVLEAALKQQGIVDITVLYSNDSLEETQHKIREALKSNLVLISGGISVGDYDFVQQSLSNLEVKEIFYKVRQKPGKPLFFGTKENKFVFGLPGNPASTLNCFYIYVLPILYQFLGKKRNSLSIITSKLASSVSNKFGRALFLKALVSGSNAEIIDEYNSATLVSFSKANALVYIPAAQSYLEKKSEVTTWLL